MLGIDIVCIPCVHSEGAMCVMQLVTKCGEWGGKDWECRHVNRERSDSERRRVWIRPGV